MGGQAGESWPELLALNVKAGVIRKGGENRSEWVEAGPVAGIWLKATLPEGAGGPWINSSRDLPGLRRLLLLYARWFPDHEGGKVLSGLDDRPASLQTR